MKLSVAIITFNEEENLERTLAPLKGLADEIIVLDSFSGDKTVEIARAAGCKLFQEPWPGHIAQKNSALGKCSGEWILSLDADEVLTPQMVETVRAAIGQTDTAVSGYLLNRRTFYLGRLLKHAWQPDYKLRLVRRDKKPLWSGMDPHDRLSVEGPTQKLPGYLIHYSFKDFAAHMQTTRKHAQIGAQSYYQAGRRAHLSDFLLRAPFHVFKRLVLKGAFLDGLPGVLAAISGGVHSYMKFAFLWELQNQKKDKY